MSKKVFKPILVSDQLPHALVIGGAGFIGFHLCKALLAKKCFVYCLDQSTKGSLNLIQNLRAKKNFKILKIKAKNPLKDLAGVTFDYIFYVRPVSNRLEHTADLIELAQKQRAKFLLISSVDQEKKDKVNETIATKYFSRLKADVRIVCLTDVYGPYMPLKQDKELALLFKNYKSKKIFKVPGDGSKPLYPLYIDDAIQGILKAMFSQDSSGKIYILAEKQKVTILKFAQAIKKAAGRSLGIEFMHEKKRPPSLIKKRQIKETQKQLNWRPKTSLNFGIKKTLAWIEYYKPEFKKKKRKRILLKLIFLTFFLTTVFLSIPLINLSHLYFQSLNKTKEIKTSLDNFNFPLTTDQVETSLEYANKGKEYLVGLKDLISFFHLSQPAEKFFSFFDLSIRFTRTANLISQIAQKTEEMTTLVIKREEGDLRAKIDDLEFLLDQLWDEINQIEADELDQESELTSQLPFSKEKIKLARDFLEILPSLVAQNGKKTYLILLQNNLELRPTGGFIVGFGLVSFENNKLLDFQINKTGAVDNQLKGRVEPPAEMKKYLGESSWYLRDANWAIHFPDTSYQAEWFLESALKRKVEGTISLDLLAFKRILSVLGPVTLEQTGEEINEGNILERAQFITALEEGDKKNFMVYLAQAIFDKIYQLESREWLKLMAVLFENLGNKEILIALTSEKEARFFNHYGWDGSVREVAKSKNVLTDFLMLAEANLGVNQANYYLKREIMQKVSFLEDGSLEEKTILAYQNLSPSKKQPGGDYKNYLRVYLPLETTVLNVKVGETMASLTPLSANEIDFLDEYAKRAIGFLVTVPAGEKRLVEISYRPAEKIDFTQGKTGYALYFQKQPGIGEGPLSLQLNYPQNWQVIKSIPESESSPPQLQIQTTTIKDRGFLIEFSPE